MSQKLPSLAVLRKDPLQERLEQLYNRKMVIENLIRSLEAYSASMKPGKSNRLNQSESVFPQLIA